MNFEELVGKGHHWVCARPRARTSEILGNRALFNRLGTVNGNIARILLGILIIVNLSVLDAFNEI